MSALALALTALCPLGSSLDFISPPCVQPQRAILPVTAASSAAALHGWQRQQAAARVAPVVTGGGGGVGWELASALALAGMRVVAVSRLRKVQMMPAGLRLMRLRV